MLEASILVRLLGVRLLTLGATVVLVPAEATVPPSVPADPQRRTLRQPNGLSPPYSGVAAGQRLAEAVRDINEGAEVLAKARHQAP